MQSIFFFFKIFCSTYYTVARQEIVGENGGKHAAEDHSGWDFELGSDAYEQSLILQVF